MASKYWIKLYHEILHDPKMGRLSDRLWRRTIEIFLMAGEEGDSGALPAVEDMAWTLRISVDELTDDLVELEAVGIITLEDDEQVVTNFAERQAAVPGAERIARYRERQRKGQYYGNEGDAPTEPARNEPVTTRYVEPERESESESETEGERAPTRPPALVVFVQETGKKLPNRQWCDEITNAVGLDPPSADLGRWKNVIHAWLGQGWNPRNVQGMLDYFKRGELPGGSRDNGTGARRATKGEPPPIIDGWTDFEEPAAPIPKHADAG